jgi:NAD(P)-dependent dehydrogenase (short-subunit alcohol dehydrogenase family)
MTAADDSMHGKVCLVTGATAGIGRATARGLAERGATVVIVARDEARAQSTTGEITRQTGNRAVHYLLADLSSQEQVRRVAGQYIAQYGQLHVLVNNAGAMFWRRRETVDGLEWTFALNHLAPFLLTNLLLDSLKASAPARVVTVASAAHQGTTIPFDDLQQAHHRYRALRVYGQSKLATILFTYELARRMEGSGVTANALHPGFVATTFGSGGSRLMAYAVPLIRPFFIGPEQGAQTSVYLATAPEVEGVTGKYFIKRAPARSSPASYDQTAAQRLWQASVELTGLAGSASRR